MKKIKNQTELAALENIFQKMKKHPEYLKEAKQIDQEFDENLYQDEDGWWI